jgi:hypothetical protein
VPTSTLPTVPTSTVPTSVVRRSPVPISTAHPSHPAPRRTGALPTGGILPAPTPSAELPSAQAADRAAARAGAEASGSRTRCTRQTGAAMALRELFVPSSSPQVCLVCGQQWAMSLRHLSLYCAVDDVWAERGCTVVDCTCPAGSIRPARPSGARP